MRVLISRVKAAARISFLSIFYWNNYVCCTTPQSDIPILNEQRNHPLRLNICSCFSSKFLHFNLYIDKNPAHCRVKKLINLPILGEQNYQTNYLLCKRQSGREQCLEKIKLYISFYQQLRANSYSVRDRINNRINCESAAFTFLIAHISFRWLTSDV